MYQLPNMDSYQKQANDLVAKINQLSQYQQPLVPTLPEPPEQIKSVLGIEGARAYLKNMPANSSAVLMDEHDNVFYVAKKDANGTPSPLAIGRFTLEQEQAETTDFVTRADFLQFKEELKQLLKGDKT